MTRRERDHLQTLQRRMEHLEARITAAGRDRSYDRAELAALRWALRRLVTTKSLTPPAA